jgi:hypothetical protein
MDEHGKGEEKRQERQRDRPVQRMAEAAPHPALAFCSLFSSCFIEVPFGCCSLWRGRGGVLQKVESDPATCQRAGGAGRRGQVGGGSARCLCSYAPETEFIMCLGRRFSLGHQQREQAGRKGGNPQEEPQRNPRCRPRYHGDNSLADGRQARQLLQSAHDHRSLIHCQALVSKPNHKGKGEHRVIIISCSLQTWSG